MEKQKSLREWSRRFPASPEVEKIMDDLAAKDDIHSAIIAVSIVESALERLIVSRLHKANHKLLEKLFQHRGPMSDLNAKILIAEAFGIITGPTADELHVMRAIRNAFAHARVHLSFSDEPVGREVHRLKLVASIRRSATDQPLADSIRLDLDNKNWFLLATRIVLIILNVTFDNECTADEVLAKALKP